MRLKDKRDDIKVRTVISILLLILLSFLIFKGVRNYKADKQKSTFFNKKKEVNTTIINDKLIQNDSLIKEKLR